jgi:hypothetical protein
MKLVPSLDERIDRLEKLQEGRRAHIRDIEELIEREQLVIDNLKREREQ